MRPRSASARESWRKSARSSRSRRLDPRQGGCRNARDIDGRRLWSLILNRIAAVAGPSAYHFARQFKAATGLPPHQYLIARRVERAKQLLQPDGDLSQAEIAARAGFSDQSQFSHHFKRIVGVTPRQFRKSAGIA